MTSKLHVDHLIDRSFSGELSALDESRLFEHTKSCDTCRARYDRLMKVDRFLNKGAIAEPSPLELDRVAARIFPAEESLFARVRKLLFAPQGLALAAAAAAAIAAFLVFVPRPRHAEEELRARGSANTAKPATVRAFCVSDGKAAEARSCSLASDLQLALGNKGGYRYVFLVGVQAGGSPRWYSPRPPAIESVNAPAAGDGEAMIGSAIHLRVNHEQGPLKIFALFSEHPLAMRDIEAAIARTKDQSLAELEALPLEGKDVAQRTVFMEVVEP